ncbi:hypothetical protein ABK040_000208 [Willaertia magna]
MQKRQKYIFSSLAIFAILFIFFFLFFSSSKHPTDINQSITKGTSSGGVNNKNKHADKELLNSDKIKKQRKKPTYCLPLNKNHFYFSVTSHSNGYDQLTSNLNALFKNNKKQDNEPTFIPNGLNKNNYFIFTDKPFDSNHQMINNYGNYFTNIVIPPIVERESNSGYQQAQYRFFRGLLELFKLSKEIKKNNFKNGNLDKNYGYSWFTLTDDDLFLIPYNYYRLISKYNYLNELKQNDINKFTEITKKLNQNFSQLDLINNPIIISRSPNCQSISGGSGVILNTKSVELIEKYLNECYKHYGNEYYDVTLFRCMKEYIIPKENELKRLNKEIEWDSCLVIFDEGSLNCCFNKFFCDPQSYQILPHVSLYERFKTSATFHYIKGDRSVSEMRRNYPDWMFDPIRNSYFSSSYFINSVDNIVNNNKDNKKEEVTSEDEICFEEDEMFSLDLNYPTTTTANNADSKVDEKLNVLKILNNSSNIDIFKQLNQNNPNERIYHYFMEKLHGLIFKYFTDFTKSTDNIQLNNNFKKEIAIQIIPSIFLIEFKNKYLSNEFKLDTLKDQLNKIKGVWPNKYQVENINIMNEDLIDTVDINNLQLEILIKNLINKLNEYKEKNIKWIYITTETTYTHIDKLNKYLNQFNPNDKLYLGSFYNLQELFLNYNNPLIGLPFGSGFIISLPFIEELNKLFILNRMKLNNNLQNLIFSKLLIPNEIVKLSASHFFRHAPEYYCTKGMSDVNAWIEMKQLTRLMDPISVTFTPSGKCTVRYNNIDPFFTKQEKVLTANHLGHYGFNDHWECTD